MSDRSAETGQYVTGDEAATHPDTTVHESGHVEFRTARLDPRDVELIAQRVVELLGQKG